MTHIDKSPLSTYSFGEPVFYLSAFPRFPACSVFRFYLHKLYNIYILYYTILYYIIVYIGVRYSVILLLLYKTQFVKKCRVIQI